MLLLSLLLLQLMSFSEDRMKELNSIVRSTPANVEKSVVLLGNYLSQQSEDEFERAYLLYGWVASNIRYDVRAYQTLSSSSRGEDVLRSRSAVCQGYAELVQLLAKEMGLKSELIAGHTRSSDSSIPNFSRRTSHAWNAVNIRGKWLLMDATWGSGYLDHKSGQFKPEFIPYYFNTPPERFIADHYPDDPKWQLLLPAISKTEFASFPNIRSDFFELGLQLYSHPRNPIAIDNELTLAFTGPPVVRIIAELRDEDDRVIDNTTLVQRLDSVLFVSVRPPVKGNYELILYGNENPQSNRFSEIISYQVESILGNRQDFPTLYAGFLNNDVYLNKPLTKNLQVGQRETFEVKSQEFKRLYLVHQNKWKRFDKDGFSFRLCWETRRGLIQIVASKELKNPNSYEVLMEYYVP